MEDKVWRILHVAPRDRDESQFSPLWRPLPSAPFSAETWRTGLCVSTPGYVINIVEAPREALEPLLLSMRISSCAGLLVCEATPFRWFSAALAGEVTDSALDPRFAELIRSRRVQRSQLCALAHTLAQLARDSAARLSLPASSLQSAAA